MKYDINLEKRC